MKAAETTDGVADTNTPRIDWFIFAGGSLLLLAVVIPIIVAPQWSELQIAEAFGYITEEMGIFYIIAACTILVYLLVIAFGKNGGLVLGPPGVEPAYSKFSWVAMLFCTGIGASLVYWGATEWTFYYDGPPFSIEPRSDEAVLWASSYGMFHWGPLAWAMYCLPTVAFCVSYHIKETPILRLSAACMGVLGEYAQRCPGPLDRPAIHCWPAGNRRNRSGVRSRTRDFRVDPGFRSAG
jgi:BCCT family betaine/carnitine transporter